MSAQKKLIPCSTLHRPYAASRRQYAMPWLLLGGLLLLLAFALSPAVHAADDVGYINHLVGSIKIDNVAAKQGSTFTAGATITSGPSSYAQLKFADGQRIFLKADSTLLVKDYQYDAAKASNSKSSLSLLKGGIRAVSGLIAKHNREAVRYETPTVTMGVRGTEFMLSIVNGQLFIHVISGAIGFIPPIDGLDRLEAGDYLALSDLGDIIGTGDAAKAAAEKAGAFQQMNTIKMEPSAAESDFQWSGVQVVPMDDTQDMPAAPVDTLETIEDSGRPEAMDAAPIGTGTGKFDRIDQ